MPRGSRIAETRQQRRDYLAYRTARYDPRLSIEDMREAARRRGGTCLSPYYRPGEPLLWRCELGHRWSRVGYHVRGGYGRGGSWCPQCTRAGLSSARRMALGELAAIARRRGGELLTTEYVEGERKLRWRCAKGHEWLRDGSGIKSGSWCAKCAGTGRLTIEEIQAVAQKRRGRCLSKAYSTTHKLLFECAKGHRWWTKGTSVTQGHWCHRCMGSGGITLDEIRALVKRHGGRCVTTRYVPGTDVVVQCKAGHRFQTRSHTLRAGHWCARCAGSRKILEDAQALAASKGGTCLSSRYLSGALLQWKCGRGHLFRRDYTDARLHWCPECSSWHRVTTADMREAAKRHGGRFLSPAYLPEPRKLEWECKRGHRWSALGRDVRAGRWCARCLGRNPTVPELRELARSRGGRFLSRAYRPRPFKLDWSCAEGHRWSTTAFLVRQGYWCPQCAGNVRLTIERMRQTAQRQGGRCLSRSYKPATKLRWRCRERHEWLQLGTVVNNGHWCPACARAKRVARTVAARLG